MITCEFTKKGNEITGMVRLEFRYQTIVQNR